MTAGAVHVGIPPAEFSLEDIQIVHFHDFLDLTKTKNEAVYSPEFSCAGHKWMLKVYPGGESESEDKMIAVYLISMSPSKVAASFAIKIKKGSGHNLDQSRGEFGDYDNFTKYVSWGWPDYISRDDISWYSDRILQNGTLTFEVRIRPHSNYYCNSDTRQSRPSDEILKQFLNREDADLAFKVGADIFPAHRIIIRCFAPELAELSETFDIDNPMPIDDVEPSTFKDMLSTVYGARIDAETWKRNSPYLLDPAFCEKSILRAANKYGFSSLRAGAEAWYMKFLELEVNNVIDNLLHADGNNMKSLKKAAMTFIVENSEEVITSESYKYLAKSPDLLSEVVFALSKKLSTTKKRKREEEIS
eukprot:scaffold112864_cov83-Cyclotella_meneghiniana.AAC.2